MSYRGADQHETAQIGLDRLTGLSLARVIARRPDTIVGFGDTRIHAETATFELRASEIANPRPDDQLVVDGQTFVIQGEPERSDPDRLVWSLDMRPA